MARQKNFQPSDSGPAVYRYAVIWALMEAGEVLHDDAKFGSRIEWACSLGAPIFGDTEEDYQKEMEKLYVDENGDPLEPGELIPRRVRLRMTRELVRRARTEGILDFKKRPLVDGTDVLKGVLGEHEDDDG